MKKANPIIIFLLLFSFLAQAQYQKLSRAEIVDSLRLRGVWFKNLLSDGSVQGDSVVFIQNGVRRAYKLPSGMDTNFVNNKVGNKADTTAVNAKADKATTLTIGKSATAQSLAQSRTALDQVPNLDATNPANTVQDATHRYATDTEKNTWNSKLNAFAGNQSQYVRGDNSLNTLDKAAVGLPNVPNVDATNPSNTVQDATHRYVSDAEKTQIALVPGKEDKFTNVPFSTLIHLNGKRMSNVYTQTAKLVFAADSLIIGGQFNQTIIANATDSLVFDTSLFVIEKDYYPQAGKINDLHYEYWSDGKVHVKVSTRNRNIPNLIYSLNNQVTFQTPAGYLWQTWTVNNNTSGDVTVYAGTTLGGSDLVTLRLIPPGESTIEPMIKFDAGTVVYLTIPSGANYTVNDTKYNQ